MGLGWRRASVIHKLEARFPTCIKEERQELCPGAEKRKVASEKLQAGQATLLHVRHSLINQRLFMLVSIYTRCNHIVFIYYIWKGTQYSIYILTGLIMDLGYKL